METFGKGMMGCEQVEAVVFDLQREGVTTSAERSAAVAHLSNCPKCAALQESWETAKEELRELGEATATRAPERIEMRLRQEFRAQHHGWMTRRHTAAAAAWALAAAVVLAVTAGVWNWRQAQKAKNPQNSAANVNAGGGQGATAGQDQSNGNSAAEGASTDDLAEFTPLPGIALDDAEEKAVLRVRMQRSSLGALGLPVNEQRAADWIQVDLLVGNDGLPQGVRLAQEEN